MGDVVEEGIRFIMDAAIDRDAYIPRWIAEKMYFSIKGDHPKTYGLNYLEKDEIIIRINEAFGTCYRSLTR